MIFDMRYMFLFTAFIILVGCSTNISYDIDTECRRDNYNEGFGKEKVDGVVMLTCLNEVPIEDVTFNIQCKSDTLNVADSEVFCTTMDGKSVRINLTYEWSNDKAQKIMENL